MISKFSRMAYKEFYDVSTFLSSSTSVAESPAAPLPPSICAPLLGVFVHGVFVSLLGMPSPQDKLLSEDSAQALLLPRSLSTASLARLVSPTLCFHNPSITANLIMQCNDPLRFVFPIDYKHLSSR